MKLGLVAGAVVLLAIAAFRRARGVLSPGPGESSARPVERTPPGLATGALVTAAMAAVAVAAIVGIVWAALELLV